MMKKSGDFSHKSLLEKLASQARSITSLFEPKKMEQHSFLWLIGIMVVACMAAILIFETHEEETTFVTDNGTWNIASNLVNGNGFSACDSNYFPFCSPSNQTTAMREPIPVFFMVVSMAISPDEDSGLIMQAVLYLLTALALYFGLKKEDVRLALLATLLWVVSIPVVKEMGDDTGHMAAAFFFTNGMILFLRGYRDQKLTNFIFSGILFGIASLSRTVELGIAVGLGFVFLALQVGTKNMKGIAHAIVFLGMIGLIFSPWVIRNKIALDAPVIGSTLTGYNLYRMNYFLGDEPFRPHYVGAKEGIQAIQQLMETSAAGELAGTENEAQMNDFYMAAGKEIILQYPFRYVLLSLYRFLILWFNLGFHAAYGMKFLIRDYLAIFQQIFFLFAVIIGSIKKPKEYWPLTLSILLGCGAYMTVGAAQLRYVIDLMPSMVILSAVAVLTPWRAKQAVD